jgi:surface carbohydrate biosynthesis protein
LVDAAEIVVFIDSTLGYEAIGRGKKTASFSCRGASLNSEDRKFGWSAGLPENGPFWTNDADERQLRRVMDYLNTVNAEEWEQTRQLYASELMEFDAGNTRFIALLDQLLSTSEN